MRRLGTLAALLTATAVASAEPKPPEKKEPAPPKPQVALESGGHTARVLLVFFTADSKELVTVSQDQTVRVWDVATGEQRRVLRPNFVVDHHNVAVAPDRKTVALYFHTWVVLLNVEDGSIRRATLPEPGLWASAMAFSPDGTRLAVGFVQHKVLILDVASHKWVQTLEGMTAAAPERLAFSPDGGRLAVLYDDDVWVADLAAGHKAPLKTGFNRSLTWSPDGWSLVLGKRDCVELWDPAKRSFVKRFEVGATMAVSFLPGGKELLTAGTLPKEFKARLSLLDAKTGKERVAFPLTQPWMPHPHTADLSPDGRLVATVVGPSDAVEVFHRDGKPQRSFWGRGIPALAAGWGPDGKSIAWGSRVSGQATEFLQKRPLQTAFDLTELRFVERPHLLEYRRAVLQLGDVTYLPEKGAVKRDGKEIALTKFGAYAISGTLLPGDRAVMGEDRWLMLNSSRDGSILDRHLMPDETFDMAPSPDHRLLLTASKDHILRVWRIEPKKLTLLLSLFVANKDWVAWTPGGYYAASPEGEQLMGWTVNHGPGRLMTFYPAEQFRNVLYRPDVIKLVLEKGSVVAAVKAADAARVAQHAPVPRGEADPEKLLPPAVTLTVLDQKNLPRVTVRASAKQGCPEQPIKSLRLMVDGLPLSGGRARAEFPAGQEKAEPEATWEVELPPGKHALSVLARTKDDTPGFSAPAEVACPLPEGQRPAAHLLAVGVSHYDRKALDLHSADGDARHLAEALAAATSPGKLYRPGVVRPLLNGQASRDAVLAAIDEVRQAARPNDLFVFAFAGHGARADGEFFLATREADPSSPELFRKTTVSGADLRSRLADFPCQVLLLLDACHSGSFAGVRPGTDEAARSLSDVDVRAAVMCAALGHEEAIEDGGGGLFTQAVVRALKGDPEEFYDRRTGELNVYHLQAFVYQEVTRGSDAKQTPYLKMPLALPAFALTRLPAASPGGQ
jgi:WD40 repeat protein